MTGKSNYLPERFSSHGEPRSHSSTGFHGGTVEITSAYSSKPGAVKNHFHTVLLPAAVSPW